MTNAHSETGQMAVCCQNLMLGVLSSHSAPSVLVGALFKKFSLFLNTPHNWSFSPTSQYDFRARIKATLLLPFVSRSKNDQNIHPDGHLEADVCTLV